MRFFSIIISIYSCQALKSFEELAVCTRSEMKEFEACHWLAQLEFPQFIESNTVYNVLNFVDPEFAYIQTPNSMVSSLLESRFAPAIRAKQKEALTRFTTVMLERKTESELTLDRLKTEIAEARLDYADFSNQVSQHKERFDGILNRIERLNQDPQPAANDYINPRAYRIWEGTAFQNILDLLHATKGTVPYHKNRVEQLIVLLSKKFMSNSAIYRIFYKSLKVIRNQALLLRQARSQRTLQVLIARAGSIRKRIHEFASDMDDAVELSKAMSMA